MALIKGMNSMVLSIVEAVRSKASELGISEGAIAICCSENEEFRNARAGNECFSGLLDGEDLVRVFPIENTNCSFTEGLRNDLNNFRHPGSVLDQISVAAKVYSITKGYGLTSRSPDFVLGYGGCVVYPLSFYRKPCGTIYVAVSGGNERQNEVCAWEAYPIIDSLETCSTTNPGPAKYGVIDL